MSDLDDLIAAALGLLGLALLVVPVISLILVSRARRRIRELEATRDAHEAKLAWLYKELKTLSAAPPAPVEAPAPVQAPAVAAVPAGEIGLEDTAPSAPATGPTTEEAGDEADTLTPGVDAIEPAAAVAPPPAEPPPPAAPPPPKVSLEERMATYFTRLGAGALVLGVLYFFKYAVDNEWIGPTGRVLAGAIVGAGVLIGAEVLRKKTKPGYVHALSGVGLAILYLSAYASAAWYALVPISVAFAATTIVLGLGAALAWRYRGEAILVLVLIAGLLSPVLLSTGEDRPLALFAYLFALTSGVLFVAAKRGFRISVGLAVTGVLLMGAGWYLEYFEVYDYREVVDGAPEGVVGAYHELSARAVPLAFTALFGAQWFGAAFLLRRGDLLTGWIRPLVTIAGVFVHVAATALLYDQALALGVGILVVGAASVATFRVFEASRLLLVPLGAAFLVLAGVAPTVERGDQTALLVLLGLWAAVYTAAFVLGERETTGEGEGQAVLPAGATWSGQASLLGFAGLAALVLLDGERVTALAGVLAAVGALSAAVARQGRLPAAHFVGEGAIAFGLLLCAGLASQDATAAWHPGLVGLTALWLVAQTVALAVLPAPSGEATEARGDPGRTLAMAGALLAFTAIALTSTHATAPTLRALFTGAAGAGALAIATLTARRGEAWADFVSAHAALALGLFAPCVAFALSGAPVTVLWAALAAIAAAQLARARTRIWLVTVQLLVAAVVLRVLSVDVSGADRLVQMFQLTRGAEGVMALPAFLNDRAYALFGAAIGLWIGAVLLARRLGPDVPEGAVSRRLLGATAGTGFVLAYGMLLTLLIGETRSALLDLPAAPPMRLDPDEFAAFWATVDAAHDAQSATLDVATTVVLGLVGLALLGAGFAAGDPFHRYLGLAVLLATVGKLVVWDVWKVSRIARVVVLTAIGALLLMAGFLYARLKVLFTTGTMQRAAGVLWLVLIPAAAEAAAPEAPPAETHAYRATAELSGITGAGVYRVAVPPALYGRTETRATFTDLRVVDADDRLVPYVVRPVPPKRPARWVDGELFDPGRRPDGGYRALFSLPDGVEHCEVELTLEGGRDFLRKVTVETGPSQDDLQVVSDDQVVFSAKVPGRRILHRNVRYPRSAARWVRLTLQPDPDGDATRIAQGRFGCLTPEARTPTASADLQIVETQRDEEKKQTVLVLDAGQSGLPIDTLHLTVEAPEEFVRRVDVAASAYRQAWPSEGSAAIFRVAGRRATAATSVQMDPTGKRYLRLTVHDEDDAPLSITAVRGSWPERELILSARGPGPHRVLVGRDADRGPSFDLDEVLRRKEGGALAEAQLGPLTDNPRFGVPAVTRPVPMTERYRGVIGIGLGALVLVLGLWAVRLLRSGAGEEG